MRKKAIIFLLAATCLMNLLYCDAGVRASESAANTIVELKMSGKLKYGVAFQILALVNEERQKEGLEPLVMDQELLDVAMQRAAECALLFSHTRPNGEICMTACSKMQGENIAEASDFFSDAETAMMMWMNSPGHRSNILGSYRSVGIGCFVHSGSVYWVQCFGAGMPTTPVKQRADEKKQMTIEAKQSDVYLVMNASEISLRVGEKTTVNLYASMKDGNQKILIDANTAKWKVSSAGTLICGDGMIHALAKGKVKLTAGIGGLSSEIMITVRGKKISLSKVKSVKAKRKKKKIVLSWKTVKGAEGYQVVYSSNKKMKPKKTKNVTASRCTLSKMKKKKTYYIKVRAYVKVSGKKVYGKWSRKITAGA